MSLSILIARPGTRREAIAALYRRNEEIDQMRFTGSKGSYYRPVESTDEPARNVRRALQIQELSYQGESHEPDSKGRRCAET